MIKTIVMLCTIINGELTKQVIMDSYRDCLKEKRVLERKHIVDTSVMFMCDNMKAEIKHDSDGNIVVVKIIKDMESGMHSHLHGGMKSDISKMEHKGH